MHSEASEFTDNDNRWLDGWKKLEWMTEAKVWYPSNLKCPKWKALRIQDHRKSVCRFWINKRKNWEMERRKEDIFSKRVLISTKKTVRKCDDRIFFQSQETKTFLKNILLKTSWKIYTLVFDLLFGWFCLGDSILWCRLETISMN